MGKVYVSHLVIHDNLKLPITKQRVFDFFKQKKNAKESTSNGIDMDNLATEGCSNSIDQSPSPQQLTPDNDAITSNMITGLKKENSSTYFSDDSGINMCPTKGCSGDSCQESCIGLNGDVEHHDVADNRLHNDDGLGAEVPHLQNHDHIKKTTDSVKKDRDSPAKQTLEDGGIVNFPQNREKRGSVAAAVSAAGKVAATAVVPETLTKTQQVVSEAAKSQQHKDKDKTKGSVAAALSAAASFAVSTAVPEARVRPIRPKINITILKNLVEDPEVAAALSSPTRKSAGSRSPSVGPPTSPSSAARGARGSSIRVTSTAASSSGVVEPRANSPRDETPSGSCSDTEGPPRSWRVVSPARNSIGEVYLKTPPSSPDAAVEPDDFDKAQDDDNRSNRSDDVGIVMKPLRGDSDDEFIGKHGIRQKTHGRIAKQLQFLDNQVAGHMHGGKSIGMIKCDGGKVLKPVAKKECADREIAFYERLQDTREPHLVELRDLVPKYFGTREVVIEDTVYNSIILEDLTQHFKEPCIMDIKIGRRTWDPLATPEKIRNEEAKYQKCKRELGFCIPGFQVYDIRFDELRKYDKDYGKSLDKTSVIQALKLFLNAETGFCRTLLVQILATLWRIQYWARKQHVVRLYSSSILIVYDAKRLKECLKTKPNFLPKLKLTRSKSLYRPLSLAVLNNDTEKVQTGFSGQLTKEGPILNTSSFLSKIKEFGLPPIRSKNNTWKKSMKALKRTHSFQNDYDKEVQDRKQDYSNILHELVCEEKPEVWATVKIIDFAHAFPVENCDIDRNYLDGVESLVKIFEDFLAECD